MALAHEAELELMKQEQDMLRQRVAELEGKDAGKEKRDGQSAEKHRHRDERGSPRRDSLHSHSHRGATPSMVAEFFEQGLAELHSYGGVRRSSGSTALGEERPGGRRTTGLDAESRDDQGQPRGHSKRRGSWERPRGSVPEVGGEDIRDQKPSHRHGSSRGRRGSARSDVSSAAGSISGHPDLARLAGELRAALARAEQRRREGQQRLQAAESEAKAAEADLEGRLHDARERLRQSRAERQAAAEQSPPHWRAQEALEAQELRREIQEAEAERDASVREGDRLEAELRGRKAGAALLLSGPPGAALASSAPAPGGDAVDALALSADVAAVNAVGADAVESMLRAEATALRTTLRFYNQQREDEARAAAEGRDVREERALREMLQQQRNEAMALEDAEAKLAMGRACMADALGADPAPDDTEANLEEMQENVAAREALCEELQQSILPLQDEVSHLIKLCNAAEAKAAQLEPLLLERFVVTNEQAMEALHATRFRGAAALVLVLAKRCGSPRIAFLALDHNVNGRLSMVEFDSSLRIRLKIDYEAITGMKLRALFKEFDRAHCGVICEEDFASCCAEVWAQYGRDDRAEPCWGALVPRNVPASDEEGDEARSPPPRSETTTAVGETPAAFTSSPGSFLRGEPEAPLQVLIVSVRGLHSPDGRSKPSPYCCCEIVGKRQSRVRTSAMESTLAPLWNYWTGVPGYSASDSLTFTVWSKTGPGRQDELLGKALLESSRIRPAGFEGELVLVETPRKQEARLKVRVTLA